MYSAMIGSRNLRSVLFRLRSVRAACDPAPDFRGYASRASLQDSYHPKRVRPFLWATGILTSVVLALGMLVTPSLVQAAAGEIIVVTTTEDNVDPCTPQSCSLRAAITLANSTSAEDTIELPAGTYVLTRAGLGEDDNATGDLDITGPVTILGEGAQNTIIDADGVDRVLHLLNLGAEEYQVYIDGVTIRGGAVDDSGGGILVGSLTRLRLENALIEDNESTGGDGGGGLYLQGSTTTVIRRSTLAGNSATVRGGGLVNNADLALENSTVSGNMAVNGGGLYNNGELGLRNVTVTANSGGGVVSPLGTSTIIQNTLIAGNADDNDCSGDIDSNGFNLVSTTCNLASTTSSDLTTDDPGLAPLALNDGDTPTHALLPDSPAIDAGNDTTPGTTGQACFEIDQRGVTRPVDGDGDETARCDIGAFEFVPSAPQETVYIFMPTLRR